MLQEPIDEVRVHVVQEPRLPLPARVVHFARANLGLMLFVVLPTLLAALYYAFIAADIYESDAQFVVRSGSSQSNVAFGLTSFLQSAGIGSSSNDSYAVAAFLTSRDALAALEKDEGIREIYNRPEADLPRRFPLPFFGSSFERLYLHYQDWTTVSIDSTSGIVTLSVFAFRPDDAQRVAKRLLELSEKLVNVLNERSLHDSLATAKHEVQHLEQDAVAIQGEITAFRGRELMLDPSAASSASMSRIATMEADLVTSLSLLSQLQQSTPHSPQIAGLQVQIESLRKQIAAEERHGTEGSDSLAPKLSQYEQLLLKQQFNGQMLQAAVASLESAEVAVQQQQLYLERVAEPNLQDKALLPTRIVNTFVVFITCLLVYGIGRMFAAAVREHVLQI